MEKASDACQVQGPFVPLEAKLEETHKLTRVKYTHLCTSMSSYSNMSDSKWFWKLNAAVTLLQIFPKQLIIQGNKNVWP